jgi:hypothetical protein
LASSPRKSLSWPRNRVPGAGGSGAKPSSTRIQRGILEQSQFLYIGCYLCRCAVPSYSIRVQGIKDGHPRKHARCHGAPSTPFPPDRSTRGRCWHDFAIANTPLAQRARVMRTRPRAARWFKRDVDLTPTIGRSATTVVRRVETALNAAWLLRDHSSRYSPRAESVLDRSSALDPESTGLHGT